MLLHNVCIVGEKSHLPKEILVEQGSIRAVLPAGTLQQTEEKKRTILFEEAIVFPGLINSHEHLDFNLFPQTANRIYPNYREWGNDIHQQNKSAINAVLQVPQCLRTQWGVYKNLLNGFTTVVNHGNRLTIDDPVINVQQQFISLHSVGFEKNWKWKLNKPGSGNLPFVIHIGEGTDATAHREIDSLLRWNIFKKPIVGVHGVAMNPEQAASFKALVWCAASNYFLLNSTADMKQLKHATPILFGTDATLTAGWNIWDQVRTARNTGMLSDEELFQSLTGTAASVWGLEGCGYLKENHSADMVVARKKNHANSMEAFYALNPEDLLLVIQNGQIRLFDTILDDQLVDFKMRFPGFSRVQVNGCVKSVVGNLPVLMQQVQAYHPAAGISPLEFVR